MIWLWALTVALALAWVEIGILLKAVKDTARVNIDLVKRIQVLESKR